MKDQAHRAGSEPIHPLLVMYYGGVTIGILLGVAAFLSIPLFR